MKNEVKYFDPINKEFVEQMKELHKSPKCLKVLGMDNMDRSLELSKLCLLIELSKSTKEFHSLEIEKTTYFGNNRIRITCYVQNEHKQIKEKYYSCDYSEELYDFFKYELDLY